MGLVIPIIISAAIYQGIVPTVAKLLDYDRNRTTAALALGSGVPMIMYLAFCLASLGGGIQTDSLSACPLFGAFAVTSLVASSLAGVNALTQECESILGIVKTEETNEIEDP